jgi:hypothetical protein
LLLQVSGGWTVTAGRAALAAAPPGFARLAACRGTPLHQAAHNLENVPFEPMRIHIRSFPRKRESSLFALGPRFRGDERHRCSDSMSSEHALGGNILSQSRPLVGLKSEPWSQNLKDAIPLRLPVADMRYHSRFGPGDGGKYGWHERPKHGDVVARSMKAQRRRSSADIRDCDQP